MPLVKAYRGIEADYKEVSLKKFIGRVWVNLQVCIFGKKSHM
jgi:hypothetical protein